MAGENASRTSFFSKNETNCPVCQTSFFREELLTGRGRLIAGELTDELRRLYEPSQKYGEVYPLIYPVTVCPVCYYSVFSQDFDQISEDGIQKLNDDTDERIHSVQLIFEDLDFREQRRLDEGTASYYLALRCYDAIPKLLSPTIKQGICAMRGAWCFDDMHHKKPEENYDYLSQVLFRKARFFYNLAVEYETNGKEAIANAGNLGPDIDQNYSYDGVLYLASYLEFYHGPRKDYEQRQVALQLAKTMAARLFGMGRASKQKPSALLDKARDLHADIRVEFEEEEDT